MALLVEHEDTKGAASNKNIIAFMCVFDNHPTKLASPDRVRRYTQNCRPEIRTLWYSFHDVSW